MKPTNRLSYFLLALAAAATAKAAPFMAVGDNAELFVTVSTLIQADDNIYLNASGAKSDTIYSFTPGLDLVFGKGSVTTGDVYLRDEIRRFGSHSKQDVDLSDVGAKADYSNGVTKASFNAAYTELAQNQVGATLSSDIARRNLTNLMAKTEFGISEKTVLSVGITYNRTDYIPTFFTDSDITTIPVDIYYQANPKLDWSFGYSYRTSNLSASGIDSKDNFFNLGARGEFTPMLTGQIRVGYAKRSFDVLSSESLLGVDGSLDYQLSQKTTIHFLAGNDFGSAGSGDSTKNFTLGLNASTQLTAQWYVNAGISRRSIQYTNRTDDYLEGTVGATYVYNNYFNVTASYTYRNNSSNHASLGTEFTNNVFALGASVRY